MVDTALPPIVGQRPAVLILGSMPSQSSLKYQQYYRHPRNSFWWIMSRIFDFEPTLDYSSRRLKLTQVRIAVWDVLYQCRRPGSLDSSIERESEIANDFPAWLNQYSTIQAILFNGGASYKLFQRHHPACLEGSKIKTRQCPSTSPAYAAMSRQQKLIVWQQAVKEIRL